MDMFFLVCAFVVALILKVAPFVLGALLLIAVLWIIWKLVALVFRGIGAVFVWLTGGV